MQLQEDRAMSYKKTPGIFISKRTSIIILILLVFICITIGLMAGLIKQGCPSDVIVTSEPLSTGATPKNMSTTTTLPVPPPTTPPCHEVWCNMRLPDYLVPIHYNLTQFPHFEHNESSFDGNVSVSIQVKQDTKILLIHINYLEIRQTNVKAANGDDLLINRTFAYEPNLFWVVEMDKEIKLGSIVFLQIEFHGSLNNGLVGYYRSNYEDARTGEKRSLATTKFQPTDARKAFPCLDEPALKATFTMTLIHKKGFVPLSNMPPEKNITRLDGFIETTFQKSPPMPTYLLAFIVCDFEYVEGYTKDKLPVRIYGRPDMINQTGFALEAAIKTTEWFNEWTNMTYQLPKLDHVNIPDYPTGATEHWGVITYGRGRLFYDPTTELTNRQQSLASVIVHEVAHNYFGNTYTCYWWDDTWLNEGFASYFEHKAMGDMELYKDWDMMEQIVPSTQNMLFSDSLLPSNPVIMQAETLDEIRGTFNRVTYSKGQAIVNMINAVMGDDKFQEGIQKLLKKYEYKSITTDQLWAELETVMPPGFDFKESFDPWVRQTGYPVLEVHQMNDTIKVSQSRFLKDINATYNKNDSQWGYKWSVPLMWVTSNNQNGNPWLKWNAEGESEFVINSFDPVNDVIKLNKGNRGFYRVNYSRDMWIKLVDKLMQKHDTFGAGDRANLIDDAFEIAMSLRIGYDTALNVTRYMAQERSPAPWKALRNNVIFLNSMFQNHPMYFCLRKHIQKITEPSMRQLSFEDVGTHIERLNRQDIVAIACEFGEQRCLDGATRYFLDWIKSNGTLKLPFNLERFIWKYGFQQNDGKMEWNFLLDRINITDFKTLGILSETRKPWLLNQLIYYAMDETKISSTLTFNVFSMIARNPIGKLILWDWYRNNWNKLVKKFGIINLRMRWLVLIITRDFNTVVKLREVKAFLKQFPEAASKAEQRAVIQDIQRNIGWMDKNEKAIIDWLAAYAC
ncbi:unnamed protein product [Owenia fusiformis]|uniref:Aminopeptidase n=1 Tax=Owenia fusiformis TaxID=6347 RepID=A0A8J1XG28_OWEFU|nr:unnamed protein product [Owenia fusiformis]